MDSSHRIKKGGSRETVKNLDLLTEPDHKNSDRQRRVENTVVLLDPCCRSLTVNWFQVLKTPLEVMCSCANPFNAPWCHSIMHERMTQFRGLQLTIMSTLRIGPQYANKDRRPSDVCRHLQASLSSLHIKVCVTYSARKVIAGLLALGASWASPVSCLTDSWRRREEVKWRADFKR